MKQKIGKVVFILFLIGFAIYLLATGIGDLTNKKDFVTVKVDGAATILEVEHAINRLIPTGKDYYYIGVENATGNAYLISGSKRWLSNNFSSEHEALDSNGVIITGLVKRISDYAIAREIENRVSTIADIQLPYSVNYCVDLNYKTKAIGKLTLLALSFFIAGAIYVIAYKASNINDKVQKLILWCLLAAVIVWLFLLLRVIR